LIPLVLSKRLHSIYLLRLFNDPIAMVFLYAGVVCWMLGGIWGAAGTILYAYVSSCRFVSLLVVLLGRCTRRCLRSRANIRMALGVKMNILLFLPGAWVMLFQIRGLGGMLESTAVIALIQVRPVYSKSTSIKA
jgi:alpha-1,3-mannosyltransferase